MDERQLPEKSIESYLMEQEERVISVSQRVTEVERRVTIVEVRHDQIANAVAKIGDTMAAISDKALLHDAAIVAIRERTDQQGQQHQQTMEEIKDIRKEQVKTSENLIGVKTQVRTLWTIAGSVAGAAGMVLIEYIFSHFLK